MKDPRGFDKDIREVAVARSPSPNQLFARTLTALVTMGPEAAMIPWPITIHQKLSEI